MLGATLGVYVGPAVPQPLAPDQLDLIEEVSITHQDTGRSGFQITLTAPRNRTSGADDFPELQNMTFKIGNRVQITARLGVTTHVLFDGIVTNLQLAPAAEVNGSRLTVTGEDLAVMMDLVELSLPFPVMADWHVAALLMAQFAGLGIIPLVIPDPNPLIKLPTEGTPHKVGTHLGILNEMAQKWGYVFYVDPGPVRGVNTGYWGPPIRAGIPQKALTWRMGAHSNLGNISFQSDGTKPKFVYGLVKEEITGATLPVVGLPFTGQPMAALPSFVGNLPFVGVKRMETDESGNYLAAMWKATGEVYRANKAAVTASGELDVGRYGDVLRARGLVDVRGAGRTMDGTWYVQSTTHTIARGRWSQSFTLEREGTIALSDRVLAV